MRATWSGPPIELWGFLNFQGSLELGYAFASLFWPELVEFEDGVFIAEQFSEASFREWMGSTGGDLTAVEAVMNHVHVHDVFLNGEADDALSPVIAERFAYALAGGWRGAAAEQFPGRSFAVDVNGLEDEDPEVTLTTIR